MSEENSFKENLNWKKISIDAVNTIIATAIGIIIGLLVDKWRENISNDENYQKVIVATINNLENYQHQIDEIQDKLQVCEDVINTVYSSEYEVTNKTMDDLNDMIFMADFMQQDRWIEENFITNGGFIENTDLRLKIGNVYSVIDLCKSKTLSLRDASIKLIDKYAGYYLEYYERKAVGAEKMRIDKDFLNYASQLTEVNSSIKSCLSIIKELTAEIISMSDADEDELNKMRESSKKINDIINRNKEEQAAADAEANYDYNDDEEEEE